MVSNNNPSPSSEGILSNIIKIVGACFVVATIIVASIIASAVVLPLFFTPQIADRIAAGALPSTAVWLSLLAFQAAASCMILLFVSFSAPGRVNYTFALGRPQASLANIAFLFAVIVVVQVLLSFLTFTFFPDEVQRDLGLFRDQIMDAPFVLFFLALVIGAPVSEELLFRGYLMNRLAQTKLGFGGATIVSTTGWTLLHTGYSTVGLIEVFLAGLLFSWVLWKTSSLWIPILFHAIHNGIVLLYLVLTQPPSTIQG